MKRFLSVCSGIEAASVAWRPLGWHAAMVSEIEPFPCAVLAHHYPDVPNVGDMTRFKEWPDAAVDLLVGGTPCQSFSVAGLRKGLADPRGNLALTFLAIAARYRPHWVVWENVPGVLSSAEGRDFAAFLGGLGFLGYGWAYRVLDAQYFGLAQRRRRVFVVGSLGGWASAGAVLFERASLRGDPAPRRKTRKDTSGSTGDGLARCPTTGEAKRQDWETCNFVAHTLRAEGFDASEDGTGRGTPLVPIAFAQNQREEVRVLEVAGALAAEPGMKQQTYIAFDCKASGRNGFGVGDVSPTLRAMGHKDSHSNAGGQVAVAIQERACSENLSNGPQGKGYQEDCAYTLEARHHVQSVQHAMQVRRLTPRECERLQGFPDDYTLIPYRGKPAADGPRYKALGNSMAVPVMRWIGRRIELAEQLQREAA